MPRGPSAAGGMAGGNDDSETASETSARHTARRARPSAGAMAAGARAASAPVCHVRLAPILRLPQRAGEGAGAGGSHGGGRAVFYDDCARCLIAVEGSQLSIYDAVADVGARGGDGAVVEEGGGVGGIDGETQPSGVMFVNAGPVLGACLRSDRGVLALRRSANEVEFIDRAVGAGGGSGAGGTRALPPSSPAQVAAGSRPQSPAAAAARHREFWQRTSRPGAAILAMFWCEGCPEADMVFATTAGLELYRREGEVGSAARSMRLVSTKRHVGTQLAAYTHASRLALLGKGRRMSGYQFTAQGLARVPSFDLLDDGDGDAGHGDARPPAQVEIVTAYGRVYCAHHTPRSLTLHRFYRDAVEPQLRLALHAPLRSLVAADDALVLVFAARVAMVVDAGSARFDAIAAPLPLGSTDGAAECDAGGADGGGAEGDGLQICAPNCLAYSARTGCAYRLELDLAALAASASDRVEAVGFLQRRQHRPERARALTLRMLRAMLTEREPLTAVGAALDVVCAAHAAAAGAAGRSPRPARHASPDDLVAEVLLPTEEQTLDANDLPYVAHAAIELARACRAAGGPCPVEAQLVVVRCLHRANREDELCALVRSGALGRSAELGRALLGLGSERTKPLALDVLHEARARGDVAVALVAAGEAPSALRYVREHRVEAVTPASFLETSAANGGSALASAVKFCRAHVPAFEQREELAAWRERFDGLSVDDG